MVQSHFWQIICVLGLYQFRLFLDELISSLAGISEFMNFYGLTFIPVQENHFNLIVLQYLYGLTLCDYCTVNP